MFKTITSSSNPYIKQIIKLRKEKKCRKKEKKILVIGKKIIKDIEKTHEIDTLITTKKELIKNIIAKNILLVSNKVMKKITNVKTPQDLAAIVNLSEKTSKNNNCVLILDNISDPGNLGSLIRAANAFEFDLIICTKKCTDPYNEKVLRAAKGATFFIPISILDDKEILAFIQKNNLTIYLADIKGTNIANIKFKKPFGLVLCNEAVGPSSFLKKIAKKITIPIKKDIDSLNVAVAGSICMYLARKS
jgi:TrmH family RNA methyltransferase